MSQIVSVRAVRALTALLLATCLAVPAAAGSLVCDGSTIGFDAGPPSDWSSIDRAGSGLRWLSLAACGEGSNYTGGVGGAACISADRFGPSTADAELITPLFSLSSALSPVLTYKAHYANFANQDAIQIEGSRDGGVTWLPLLAWQEDHGRIRTVDGETVRVQLTPLAGSANVRLRWRYRDLSGDAFGWLAQIDDVTVACDDPGCANLPNPIADSGFEAGGWSAQSSSGLSPLCIADQCGVAGARSGSGYLELGGTGGAAETASASQVATLPLGIATLSFYLWIPSEGLAGDELTLSIDGTPVSTVSALDDRFRSGYRKVEVGVSEWADGTAHELTFASATGSGASFLLDDVAVIVCPTSVDDPPLSVSDVAVVEGNAGLTTASVRLRLSSPTRETVTVGYSTRAVTATPLQDYQDVSGTATFAPGVTLVEIPITIAADTIDEPDESLLFELGTVTNATASDLQATVTIFDDDQTYISVGDGAALEIDDTSSTATFLVTLSRPNSTSVSVNWRTVAGTASPGIDYTEQSNTLSFPAGTTQASITILVLDDRLPERDETFTLVLSNPTRAAIEDPEGAGRIIDNDRGRYPNVGSDILYTVDGDFDLARLHNLTYAEVADQLQLVSNPAPLPNIWVAASARNTIVRIDTRTGTILGEYRTAPQAGAGIPNPSRTTVALDGSVWAGNRGDRSIVHVGRVEAGQCVDRNGDGQITTSRGYGDVLPWPNVDRRDSDGGVETAVDECVVHYTKTSSGGTRHVSIDAQNRLWVSGISGRIFDLVDGETGAIVRSVGPMPCGGYGGLVDRNGVVWSTSGGVLRWDPAVDPPTPASRKCIQVEAYGLALAPSGEVWASGFHSNRIWKIRSDGGLVSGPYGHGSNAAQGLATSANGDVWVSSGSWGNNSSVGHVRADGSLVGNVTGVPKGTTGIAVDAEGKIWAISRPENSAARIDPNAGPVGPDGVTRVGKVDLIVPLAGATPYNYSDMTGALVFGSSAPRGSFRVLQDSGSAGTSWGRIQWNTESAGRIPAGSEIRVEARTADAESQLGGASRIAAGNGVDFASAGRLIEVVVTLVPNAAGESPVLSDLRVSTASATDPAVRKIQVSNAEVTETNLNPQTMTFTLTLSTPSDGTVRVAYTTASGDAQAGVDFTPATGTVVFNATESSKTVAVTIAGDTLIEDDESFFVDLSSPVSTLLGDARGVGTIRDNDGIAVPVVSDDRLYTLDDDFDLGALWNTHHLEPLEDQLQVVSEVAPFPFLWIAASNRGTIVKIDTRTGEILGEYSTNPDAGSAAVPNPSRTTVTLDGSVWAGNRGDGSVIHVGLVEEGQCIDRNGNGVIETSRGYGNVLAWPNVGGTSSGGGVSQALDECILHYVKVRSSVVRHVSVDRSGNVWVTGHGGANDRDFELLDGRTGAILRTEHNLPCGGYGGLVDKNGIVWSVHTGSRVLRWDPAINPRTAQSARCVGPSAVTLSSSLNAYGIAIGRSGSIYVTEHAERFVWKIAPDGNSWQRWPRSSRYAQGLAVDDEEQVWVSSAFTSGGTATIDHFDGNTGTFVGQVSGVPRGSTGIAVDANGKIWAAILSASGAARIDPTKGNIGAGGIRIGAVDLSLALGATTGPTLPVASPYNYSDMTGYLSIRSTAPLGRWRVIQDGGEVGTLWGRVSWNGEEQGSVPAGGSIVVEVRAADSVAALGSKTFVTVTSGSAFSQLGRFIEVRVTLRPNASGVSPILSDLRIETVDSIDPARISIGPSTVVEGDVGFVTALLPVTLSRVEAREVLVDWHASGGSALEGIDFEALQGTVVFPPGVTEALIEIPVRGDLVPELSESYLVELERPVHAELGSSQGLGTIVDDDEPVELSIGDVTVEEGDAGTVSARFPITLSAIPGQAVRLDWATEGATATAPADYGEGANYLILDPGVTSGEIVIEVNGDLLPEADETFRVVLSGVEGAAVAKGVGVGTILDDDLVELRISDVTVDEGDSGTTPALFDVTTSKPTRLESTVAWTTVATPPETATAGGDFVAASGTLTIPEGGTGGRIAIDVNGDLLLEPDETFRVELSDPVAAVIADGSALGTIVDDEECLGPNLLRNPGAEERPVPTATGEPPGWQEVSGTTWTWRRNSTTLPAYEGIASFAAGAVATGELAQTVSLSMYAAQIDGGGQEIAFRGFVRSVDVVSPDFTRIVVEYRDESGEAVLDAFDSGDLISPAGWEEVVDVRTAPIGTRFVRVRLLAESFDGQGDNGAAFDALELRSLRTAAITQTGFDEPEGDSGLHDGIFRVNLSCPFGEPVVVGAATSNGTATGGVDYLSVATELSFAPGEVSKPVPVPIVGDLIDEPHEALFLNVSEGSSPGLNGAVIVEPRETGIVRNDDACQRTPGYWALHPTAWPVEWLVLGNKEFERPALQTLLNDTGNDMSKTLARQLIATKFNLLVGTKPLNILTTVTQADAWLVRFPPGSNPKGPDKTQGEQIKNALMAYNSIVCPVI